MKTEDNWNKFIERVDNFHWNSEQIKKNMADDRMLLECICYCKDSMIAETDKPQKQNRKEFLDSFLKEFNCKIEYVALEYKYGDLPQYDNVYAACYFVSLCMFMQYTVRVKGKSITDFIFKNSLKQIFQKLSKQLDKNSSEQIIQHLLEQIDKNSSEQIIQYLPEQLDKNLSKQIIQHLLKQLDGNFSGQLDENFSEQIRMALRNKYDDVVSFNTSTFRKQRHRLLSSRPVYNKRPEWSTFSKNSEHEWNFKYVLENLESINKTIPDTFKRLGNLYNDVNTVLCAPYLQGSKYDENKIKEAYKKFTSKLEKIKYQNYLNLVKVVFTYFFKNDEYYGINLYRIEKEFRPYITINEVNQLLTCKTVDEENILLKKSALLNSICFPKVYADLSVLSSSDIYRHSLHFSELMHRIILINCLIIDELVEKGYLGEDWYAFLRITTNEMAKEIFYDPNDINEINDINDTAPPKSQDSFMKIFSVAVQHEIYKKFGIILS